MSTYKSGEWTHENPTCPTCCAVRARQGFETPAVLGDDCEACKAAKEAAIYYASDAYKAEVAARVLEALPGVLIPGEAGMVPSAAVDLGTLPPLDYGMEQ